MTAQSQSKLTSHVGRDLLASAASFKNEAVVAWEYVVNSLQYVDPGVSPRIQVTVLPGGKGIRIADNGSGMSVADLKHFFQMHGENLERRSGRPGRGKFGTGKSAAFGIASTLRVDTVHNGKRNVVVLTRNMINASDGEEIPVDWTIKNEPTDDPNGTTISILDIYTLIACVGPPSLTMSSDTFRRSGRSLRTWLSMSMCAPIGNHPLPKPVPFNRPSYSARCSAT